MTKLKTLRRQLSSLRRARQFTRMVSAFSATIIAVLWMLAAVFVIDLLFALFQVDLTVAQRVILLCFAAAGIVAGFVWYTLPLLGVKESRDELALLVEQEQEISSDLIAALQFESPEAPNWGSVQLETAVVDRVARIGGGLRVFKGFPLRQLTRRFLLMVGTVGLLAALIFVFPAYAKAYFNRLAFGSQHYPTRTVIEQVVVNRVPLLVRDDSSTAPMSAKSAEGKPLEFVVQCSGTLPGMGTIELESFGDGPQREVSINMTRLTVKQRLDRLTDAAGRVRHAIENPGVDVQGPWAQQLNTLVRFDAPQAVEFIDAAQKDRSVLTEAVAELDQKIKKWPGNAGDTSLYTGTLSRMVEPVVFQTYLGDAWTDPAAIHMIPLPVIELDVKVTSPEYAREGATQYEPTARHLAVLESSRVDMAIECKNDKELAEAWLIAQSPGGLQKYPLIPDTSGKRWELKEDAELPRKIDELLAESGQTQDPIIQISQELIPFDSTADLSAVQASLTEVSDQQDKLSRQAKELANGSDGYLTKLLVDASNRANSASQLFSKTAPLLSQLAKLTPAPEPESDESPPLSDEFTKLLDQIITNIGAAQSAAGECREALERASTVSQWFASFGEELRFQIQVTDKDGLHLDSPLSGYIRLKADRPPSGTLHVVHKVVLPTAKPVLEFEIQDDYGISEVLLHVETERKRMGGEALDKPRSIPIDAVMIPAEKLAAGALIERNGALLRILEKVELEGANGKAAPGFSFTAQPVNRQNDREKNQNAEKDMKFDLQIGDVVKVRFPLPKGVLPTRGARLVDLASFGLEKGDRLRLELEVVDYRGALNSESIKSDPLILEVSDESGVVAAITEPDERSEKKLNDSILLELGIGESP